MTDADTILEFLGSVHPYDNLSQEERARVARSFSRREWQAGETVFQHGEPLAGLFLIESAGVEVTDRNGGLVSMLSRGNSFGERGLMRGGLAATTAMVSQPGVILMLPLAEFKRLMAEEPAFARFFNRGRGIDSRATEIATLKVSDFLTRKPMTCPPDATVADAARTMRDAHVSSLGVTEGEKLVGLLTVRDMSNRVVAEGLPGTTLVRDVMTADPISLPPSALGSDVLHIMLEKKVGHLPVVDSGRFAGMITQTDLTRVQAVSSAVLIRDVGRAERIEDMAAVTARIPELLVQLMASHQRHEVVTRLITDIADAVTRRLLAMAQERLGEAPARWLWAACGSQGRQEQTGVSDQDNCLILADGADPDHPYFIELAKFVSDGLDACGYYYCPGDMMATNPRWRQPLNVWNEYFRGWIVKPSPEAQMLASVMFDLRAIGGDATLLNDLQANTLEMASKNSIFVAHMISNSLKHTPPLGLIRSFATIRSGEHRNQIDMKHNGVVPVTDLGRVYSLYGKLTPVNTRARLVAAEEAGVISSSGGADLVAAYDLIQTTRLESQAAEIREGRKPDNYLSPSDLPDLARSHLRDAFVVVRTMQSSVGQGKGALS